MLQEDLGKKRMGFEVHLVCINTIDISTCYTKAQITTLLCAKSSLWRRHICPPTPSDRCLGWPNTSWRRSLAHNMWHICCTMSVGISRCVWEWYSGFSEVNSPQQVIDCIMRFRYSYRSCPTVSPQIWAFEIVLKWNVLDINFILTSWAF